LPELIVARGHDLTAVSLTAHPPLFFAIRFRTGSLYLPTLLASVSTM
jgi:hypothetical protein